MITSEAIDKLSAALVKAQVEMLPLVKDSNNPFFKSKYADLHAVTEACYPALRANGISVIQSAETEGEGLDIKTRLLHSSGQFIETSCVIPPAGNDPQKYGSAVTYGRRYGLQAAVGLAPTDDDAEGAMNRGGPPKKQGITADQIAKALMGQTNLKDLKAKYEKAQGTEHKGSPVIERAFKLQTENLKK